MKLTSTVPPGPDGEAFADWLAWANAVPTTAAAGFQILTLEPGHCVVRMDRSEWPLNPSGAVHGGLVLAWADHCLGLLMMPVIPAGALPATVSLTSQFVRPAMPPLTFDAQVQRLGATVGFATVDVRDREGRLATRVSGVLSVDGSSRPRG